MAFETFTGRQKVTNEPRVSILKQGNFNFNNGATKLLQDKSVTYIQLHYDPENNRIGFKPCNKKTTGAYKLRESKGGAQISGMAFLRHYQIDYKERTRSYPAYWDEDQQMLVINLD